MKYTINHIGICELKRRRKENFKLFFIFPLFFLLYLFLTYISMRGTIFFWATLPLFTLMYIFIGIYAPIVAAKRFSKVVTSLIFSDSSIILKTDKINFKEGKIMNLMENEFNTNESNQIYYGNGKAQGLIIKLNSKDQYFLIKSFYDNYDAIKLKLKIN